MCFSSRVFFSFLYVCTSTILTTNALRNFDLPIRNKNFTNWPIKKCFITFVALSRWPYPPSRSAVSQKWRSSRCDSWWSGLEILENRRFSRANYQNGERRQSPWSCARILVASVSPRNYPSSFPVESFQRATPGSRRRTRLTSTRERKGDPRINDDAFVSPRLASIDEPNLSADEKALIAVEQIVDMRRFFLRLGRAQVRMSLFFYIWWGRGEKRARASGRTLLSQVGLGPFLGARVDNCAEDGCIRLSRTNSFVRFYAPNREGLTRHRRLIAVSRVWPAFIC